MGKYISVEEALGLPGLRVAFTRGVPGPWSESAKAIFQLKRIHFAWVAQDSGDTNDALQRWTGQSSAPVAMFEDERPRSHWSEILLLAERLAAEPRLVPAEAETRALMFGIAHEICGEDGFGWNARLLMLNALEGGSDTAALNKSFDGMKRKYTNGELLDHARARVIAVMAMLARRLAAQHAAGSHFLVGNAVSAADIYWTTFSNLVACMSEKDCPAPDFYRTKNAGSDPHVAAHIPPILIAHRESILHEYFSLPMEF